MPDEDPLKRPRELGAAFVQMARGFVEDLVREVTRAGEGQPQERVEALIERGRRSAEALANLVREEVARQFAALRGEREPSGASEAGRRAAKGTGRASRTASGSATKAPAGKQASRTRAPGAKRAAKKAPGSKRAAQKATGVPPEGAAPQDSA